MGISPNEEGENKEAASPSKSPGRKSPSPNRLGMEESKEVQALSDDHGETKSKKKQDTDCSDDELEIMDAGQYVQMV